MKPCFLGTALLQLEVMSFFFVLVHAVHITDILIYQSMEKLDGRSIFVVDDSTTPDDATMQLIDLIGIESTNLNITNSNESNSNTHLLAHNVHEEINLQNDWVSSLTISRNQESDLVQELRNEANQSQLMCLINANNQRQQNFSIPSSSSTMNSLPNPSRKRNLLDLSSKSPANGSSSYVITNTNPKNSLNQFNSLLGFNKTTSAENVENSRRNCRLRINPQTSSNAASPLQWNPVSNLMQENTSMPINQPLIATPSSIQNVRPFSINVASNSRASNLFTRYDATRSTMENMRSNIQEGTGHNRLFPNPYAHSQPVPQGVIINGPVGFTTSSGSVQAPSFNNNGTNSQIALLQAKANELGRYNGLKLRGPIIRAVGQLSKTNYVVEQVVREGRRKILWESILSFVHAKYHRRVVDLQGRHRDMHLDDYNISFEELLAIGERIGNAISEENIINCLKQPKYISPMKGVLNEMEPCCICQEEYRQEENMVRLYCGHDFHINCITKWLMLRNSCPICATIGPIIEIAS